MEDHRHFELSAFSYNQITLTLRSDIATQTPTPLEITAEIVDKLCYSRDSIVQDILDKNKTVKRLWVPAINWTATGTDVPDWNIDTHHRQRALALYLFLERRNKITAANPKSPCCRQCNKLTGPSPGRECFLPIKGYKLDACTNCIYSGRGKNCSFTEAAEMAEMRRQWKESKGPTPLTKALLTTMPLHELQLLLGQINEAIKRRLILTKARGEVLMEEEKDKMLFSDDERDDGLDDLF
ncbi:hypothetical protein QBC44DRAFT_338082 [Cladorrhinum sp. PSN332]|nr:hypothetical protein QBC44DRAFT_338082 [Cladorrhinum sp. PSN332]